MPPRGGGKKTEVAGADGFLHPDMAASTSRRPSPAKTTPAGKPASAPKNHTRNYQACIPCRNRKVRCDLGNVDEPQDPPCKRCKRESKECYFSSTRRKRKSERSAEPGDSTQPDDYEKRNGRKRARPDHSSEESSQATPSAPAPASSEGPTSSQPPMSPGGHAYRRLPLKRPGSIPIPSTEDDEQAVTSTAAYLQHSEVFHQGDALDLLAHIAEDEVDVKRERSTSMSSVDRVGNAQTSSPNVQLRSSDNPMANGSYPSNSNPATGSTHTTQFGRISSGTNDAIRTARKAWSKVRFVNAGWFTPDEGMNYIDYFYQCLSPMTPITVPDFRDPAKHAKLLTEEPILALTILTISSRYFILPGPGSASRGFTIHDELWRLLQAKLNRVIWAQEKFGSGFSGAGSADRSKNDGPTNLRSMGTVESLLLLTEWHCRSLHFPPGEDNELMNPLDAIEGQSPNPTIYPDSDVRGRKIDTWLEPCWRSERMCWTLLGLAMALAFELGIFDDDSNQISHDANATSLESRGSNLRKLLFVYITQTSGRLSLKSMLPEGQANPRFYVDPLVLISQYSDGGQYAGTRPNAAEVQQIVLYFWCELTLFMKDGNRDAFPNREFTRELINTGKYISVLHKLGDRLRKLRKKFDECDLIPPHMRHILNIEFEYNRAYTNSLALQAVFTRCTNNTTNAGDESSPSNKKSGVIPPRTLMKWAHGDRLFINDIVEACNKVLQCVVDDLTPNDSLKHAPVRTFFRIISVSMMMLKCFALGQGLEQAAHNLGLFDRAAVALQTSIVDDVHVASRIADLLQNLAQRMRGSLIRISNHNEASRSGSRRGSRARTPQELAEAAMRANQSPGYDPNNFASAGQQTYHQPAATASASNFQQQQPYTTGPTFASNHAPHNLYGRAPMQNSYMWNYAPQTPGQYNEDPLRGINQQQYDPMNPNMSIIPPVPVMFHDHNGESFTTGYSNRGPQSQGSNEHSAPGAMENTGYLNLPEEWIALPLEPILGTDGADVSHTGFGPELGGQDMLDFYAQQYAP